MKISIGCDHAGYAYKEAVKRHLSDRVDVLLVDHGAFDDASVDYPDFAHAVAQHIDGELSDFGILICGSANGVAMTANKYSTVRCAMVWSEEITRLARTHNDANILALPARFISVHQALHYVDVFLTTSFEGGRHARRVNKIACS